MTEFIHKQVEMKPPPQKCIWSRYDLHLWPLLENLFRNACSHGERCAKFCFDYLCQVMLKFLN